MEVSRDWLQGYFERPLPDAQALAEALTFHAFEIESVENDILDVKVTPNRGHDCLSHRGIAKELSAILNMPLKNDPLRSPISGFTKSRYVQVEIEDPKLCPRYIAGYIKGVKVGPSPEWLRKSLEAVGQKSINNVVDATNYVMFNLGQPLHAFDAGQLSLKDEVYAIRVRSAKKGENMLALDDKEYTLSDSDLVIVDGNTDVPIGIAGVKGGKPAGIGEATKDIIIESANFDGISVRKTSQALKLRTDASTRFEQVISPELAGFGMRAATDLIVKLAGGEIVGFADEYHATQEKREVAVSITKVNGVLGTKLNADDVSAVFKRLDLPFTQQGDSFTVSPPFERLDLVIPEDLIEEVGRIVGYDKVPAVELPAFGKMPEVNKDFLAAERTREELVTKGYSEVYTSVFADTGERAVANKVDSVKPYLRANLADGLKEAFERNTRNKDLLGLKNVKLFEIGTIWRSGAEEIFFGTIDPGGAREAELTTYEVVNSAYEDLPISQTERYQPFSKYPFIVRDIALWVPADTVADKVLNIIRTHAGELLVRGEQFDEFKKGDKTSYAFRLVFQSFDRTLTDEDANGRMESVYAAVKKEGWEVR